MSQHRKILATLFVASLGLMLPATSYADKGGNGGGNSGHNESGDDSHGDKENHGNTENHGDKESLGKGEDASELKGLNSSHASEAALDHASDRSRVGRNRIYLEAAIDTKVAKEHLENRTVTMSQAQAALDWAQLELLSEIAAGVDTTAAEAAVNQASQELTLAQVRDAIAQAKYEADLVVEQEALLNVTDGRIPSDDALAEYRSKLGL